MLKKKRSVVAQQPSLPGPWREGLYRLDDSGIIVPSPPPPHTPENMKDGAEGEEGKEGISHSDISEQKQHLFLNFSGKCICLKWAFRPHSGNSPNEVGKPISGKFNFP